MSRSFLAFRWGMVALCAASLFLGSPQSVRAEDANIPSFRQAYEQEKRELEQTRKGLQETLRQLQQENQRRKTLLQGKVRHLMTELSGLRKTADGAEEQVQSLKRRWSSVREYKELLKGTLQMGTRTLREEIPSLRLEGGTPQQIRKLFSEGAAYLRQRASVHETKGDFFDLEGHQIHGRIVHVGEIAALGFGEGQGGVLRRLPGGGLRLIPPEEDHLKVAKALVAGKFLATIPVYLFDPLSKSGDPAPVRTAWATIEAGGPIAWIILALGLFGLLLLMERLWTLSRLSVGREGKWKHTLASVREGDQASALLRVRGMGIAAPVLEMLIQERESTRESLEQRSGEVLLQQMPRLERSVALLNVLVTVAPLLGLLGTVTGMISTFDVITTHGTGNPRLLSQGISEALITTELGLAVAIPLLLAKSFFARWGDRLLETTQLRALTLLHILKGASSSKEQMKTSSEVSVASREQEASR
ncbi:MAG: MotA/TolQ/ExbB proton channel family protein [Myxococcales bacterium]|nr:MotA/TolQ/ExbB proton channel family protein [Myxococcales bacterium]